MTRSSSPVLSEKVFDRASTGYVTGTETMTVNGTINKTFILLLLLLATALFTWNRFFTTTNPNEIIGYIAGGAIAGLIIAIVLMFKPQWVAVLAPAYALCEGLFVGGISAFYSTFGDGLVMQAVSLTFGVLFVMLGLYKFGVIKVTQKLRSGIIAATAAVGLFYLVMLVMSLFGVTNFYASSSPLSIGISLLVVGIAAFNLLLDFDFIEEGSKRNSPKYMEWFGAFGLLVTLVWLYIEILRLLSKLRN